MSEKENFKVPQVSSDRNEKLLASLTEKTNFKVDSHLQKLRTSQMLLMYTV